MADLSQLLESGMLDKAEHQRASSILKNLDEYEAHIWEIFGPKLKDQRFRSLGFHQSSFTEEISNLRECAFWLLASEAGNSVEFQIATFVAIYEDVRGLIWALQVKGNDSSPERPVRLAPLPSNRYAELAG